MKTNAYIRDWQENRAEEIKELTGKGIIPVEHDMDNAPDEVNDEQMANYRPWLMGQAAAALDTIKPAKEIVDELVNDAVVALKKGHASLVTKSKL